jgi:nitroreductase
MIHDLVRQTRSYRRFRQGEHVDRATLQKLVDLARLSASGANRQPLKYYLSADPETNAAIFPHLGWAAYLPDWKSPQKGERPAAYIIVLGDTQISQSFGIDHGIACQSMLLGATERGLGGCIIASIKKQALREALSISDRYQILLVVALGVPTETVVIDPVGPDGDIKYWRDGQAVHHVPKRDLDDLIIN